MKKLDLSGEGKASDAEIEIAADDIMNILLDFKSPKDAGSAFAFAHWKMIKLAFPPEYREEALSSVKTHCKLMKEFIDEGWQ